MLPLAHCPKLSSSLSRSREIQSRQNCRFFLTWHSTCRRPQGRQRGVTEAKTGANMAVGDHTTGPGPAEAASGRGDAAQGHIRPSPAFRAQVHSREAARAARVGDRHAVAGCGGSGGTAGDVDGPAEAAGALRDAHIGACGHERGTDGTRGGHKGAEMSTFGAEFELARLPRTFRVAEEVVVHTPRTGESNPTANSMRGGGTPVVVVINEVAVRVPHKPGSVLDEM